MEAEVVAKAFGRSARVMNLNLFDPVDMSVLIFFARQHANDITIPESNRFVLSRLLALVRKHEQPDEEHLEMARLARESWVAKDPHLHVLSTFVSAEDLAEAMSAGRSHVVIAAESVNETVSIDGKLSKTSNCSRGFGVELIPADALRPLLTDAVTIDVTRRYVRIAGLEMGVVKTVAPRYFDQTGNEVTEKDFRR